MNHFGRVLLTSIVASLAGCIGTDAALTEVGKPVHDSEIVGTWKVERCSSLSAKEEMKFRISREGEDVYFMETLDSTDKHKTPLGLVDLDGAVYAQSSLLVDSTKGEDAQHSPKYFFPTRIERRGDWLAIRELNYETLTRSLKPGQLRDTGPWKTVSLSPQELASFLKENGDEIYDEGMICRRVSESQTPDSTPITK